MTAVAFGSINFYLRCVFKGGKILYLIEFNNCKFKVRILYLLCVRITEALIQNKSEWDLTHTG